MIVVDASVAAKWVLPEPDSDKAEALYNDTIRGGEQILAPSLLRFEVANILRQRMVRVGLALGDADRLMAQFLRFSVTLITPPETHRHALALADAHELRAAYDAHYIALARLLGCELWTDDQRLLRQLGGALPFVRALADYPGP